MVGDRRQSWPVTHEGPRRQGYGYANVMPFGVTMITKCLVNFLIYMFFLQFAFQNFVFESLHFQKNPVQSTFTRKEIHPLLTNGL